MKALLIASVLLLAGCSSNRAEFQREIAENKAAFAAGQMSKREYVDRENESYRKRAGSAYEFEFVEYHKMIGYKWADGEISKEEANYLAAQKFTETSERAQRSGTNRPPVWKSMLGAMGEAINSQVEHNRALERARASATQSSNPYMPGYVAPPRNKLSFMCQDAISRLDQVGMSLNC